jgi:hypothetical protein
VNGDSYSANGHADAPPPRDPLADSLLFQDDEHGLIEVELAELWLLQDRHREAVARCGRLVAENRELKERFRAMRDELLLMSTERKMMLDARSGAS